MRNPLHKSLKKEFLRNRSRYISLSLVLILMIGVVTGFLSVAYSAKELLIKDGCKDQNKAGSTRLKGVRAILYRAVSQQGYHGARIPETL